MILERGVAAMRATGRARSDTHHVWWVLVIALLLLGPCATQGRSQLTEPPPSQRHRPFAAGEVLVYNVRVGSLAAGSGVMWIEGPEFVRGHPTLLLRSHMEARVGPLGGSGETESWIDADRLASLRFERRERRLFSRSREAVELFPVERRWTADDGRSGRSPTDDPLDELSFIYYIRTLPLPGDTSFSVSRHFEPERNPVSIRVVGREAVTVPAGTFDVVTVEMRVKDPRRYRGEGVIRISLTDDRCRLPVRIESDVPTVGRTVLTLERVVHPDAHLADHGPLVGGSPTAPLQTPSPKFPNPPDGSVPSGARD
jgi:hypothetical protein